MVTIQEDDGDADPNQSRLTSASSLSYQTQPNRREPPPSAPFVLAVQQTTPQPDSPGTVSSISSDHTFHGFSPTKDNLPSASPSPSPPVNPAGAPPPEVNVTGAPPPQFLVPVPVPAVANWLIRDQPESVTKTESNVVTGFAEGGGGGGSGGGGRRGRRSAEALRRERILKRVGLGLRVCEFVVCLGSFSVMAADKNRGWALDSFDRYIEFRYSLSVNIIGFAYAALQGFDLLRQLATGKDLAQNQLRYCVDFAIDQILAYLLLSASSSAYTRVDDWISNWGQDKFPAMAGASVAVSFLAFVAFALSSLVSGYILYTHRFT